MSFLVYSEKEMLREKFHFRVSLLGFQLLFLSFLLSLFFPKYSFAQTEDPRWERMGLEGWEITGNPAVAINPIDPKIVYVIAHTENTDPNDFYSEVYDLFKTTNSGVSWESKKNGLPTNNSGLYVSSIAIDPINPETLFVATQEGWGPFRDGGIYKTVNGGNTWTRVLRGLGYMNLIVDFENPNIVFALNAGLNNPFGFYRSIDGGILWERKGAGIVTYPTDYRKIILDPTNHSIVYVLANPYNGSSGVFKSTDSGEYFMSIPDIVGLGGQAYDIAINHANNQSLYAAVGSYPDDNAGVYKSSNGGNTWFRSSNGLDNADARNIEIDPLNSNILYIVAYKARQGQGILINSPYYSIDGAQTWFSFNDGLPTESNFSIGEMFTSKNFNYLIAGSPYGLWKHPLVNAVPPSPTPTTTFTPTPTPTPQLCVLEHFGDFFGNPVRQDDDAWGGRAYGGIYFDLVRRRFTSYDPDNANLTFLPFVLEGNNQDTIERWGCAMTSSTMILNYAAVKQNIFFPSYPFNQYYFTPLQINEWLQKNQGFDSGEIIYVNGVPAYVNSGYVNPNKIQEFAKTKNIYAQIKNPIFANINASINYELCRGNPAKIKVNNPTPNKPHFVAISGQAYFNNQPTFRIHDPLANTPLTLSERYGYFTQAELVDTNISPLYISAYVWRLHSPAELLVTDPNGRKTGIDPRNNTTYSDITGSVYYEDELGSSQGDAVMRSKVLRIENPLEGSYSVDVIGTGEGSYAIDFSASNEHAEVMTSHVQSTIKKDVVDLYTVDSLTQNNEIDLIRQITIAIKPNAKVNPKSNEAIQVVILGTPTFDATTVDFASVVFGANKVSSFKKTPLIQDVDKDGDLDYLVYFKNRGSGIVAGDSKVCIEGKTTDFIPVPFQGCAPIQTLPQ